MPLDRLFDSSMDQLLHGLRAPRAGPNDGNPMSFAPVLTPSFPSLARSSACSHARRLADGKAAPPPPAPPEVSVITVAPETVALTASGSARSTATSTRRFGRRCRGYLVRRNYEEGALVRKGQVLFEIDPRPFEAVLAQAQARLAEAQAQLGKTERDLQRDRPLAEQRAIAQSQLDNDIQADLAAQAAIKSATAAIETAQLNLGFTKSRRSSTASPRSRPRRSATWSARRRS